MKIFPFRFRFCLVLFCFLSVSSLQLFSIHFGLLCLLALNGLSNSLPSKDLLWKSGVCCTLLVTKYNCFLAFKEEAINIYSLICWRKGRKRGKKQRIYSCKWQCRTNWTRDVGKTCMWILSWITEDRWSYFFANNSKYVIH